MSNPLYTSDALETASDTNYSSLSDPYDGTPIKATPMLAKVKQGARPGKQQPARYYNWLQNQFALILKSLIGDLSREVGVVFTSSGTWTAPADVWLKIDAYGGGGGAGSGHGDADATTDIWNGGGAGGGGAVQSTRVVFVSLGTVITITVGAGGAGGSTSGANGSDGGSTSAVVGIAVLGIWLGGQGGRGGIRHTNGAAFPIATGGAPCHGTQIITAVPGVDSTVGLESTPQHGGGGISSNNTHPRSGNPSPQGYVGGVAVTNGTDDGSYRGGGAGGGGGAGPGGDGGTGSAGGNGTSATTTYGGLTSAPTNAPANSGAGGGGSGGQGSGTLVSVGIPSGANGGSGKLTLAYMAYGAPP